MNFKCVGPLLLLAALVIGDQIRINRPTHKYRLTVEVETPEGVKSASGVMAVHPDRSYSRGGKTRTIGDAVFVDLGGGKNLVALLAHVDKSLELDDINYVALRAYKAAGQNVSFSQMSRMTGTVPVKGEVIPVLVSFADPADPATARLVPPDDTEARAGEGHPAPRHFGRGGAERRLAARFRRSARRARDPRHRGETAVAERCGQCGGQGGGRRCRPRDCRPARPSMPGRLSRGNSNAGPRCRRGILIRCGPGGMIHPNYLDPRLATGRLDSIFAMRRPVVGVIANAYRVENRFPTQMIGERNLRAVADVAGALPLMFAGCPKSPIIGALLDVVDGVILTGARANVHPTHFRTEPHPATSPTTSTATTSRWRCRRPASPAAYPSSASAAACRR